MQDNDSFNSALAILRSQLNQISCAKDADQKLVADCCCSMKSVYAFCQSNENSTTDYSVAFLEAVFYFLRKFSLKIEVNKNQASTSQSSANQSNKNQVNTNHYDKNQSGKNQSSLNQYRTGKSNTDEKNKVKLSSPIQEIFSAFSLEYILSDFLEDTEARLLLLKIMTFISTHAIKQFFSYELLWKAIKTRGLIGNILDFSHFLNESSTAEEKNNCNPSKKRPSFSLHNENELFDQIHLLWELRKYFAVDFSLAETIASLHRIIAVCKRCKIKSIVLHLVIALWERGLLSISFSSFIPAEWTCRNCRYCRDVFYSLGKKMFLHFNDASFNKADTALMLNLAMHLKIDKILHWAWQSVSLFDNFWFFFMENSHLLLQFELKLTVVQFALCILLLAKVPADSDLFAKLFHSSIHSLSALTKESNFESTLNEAFSDSSLLVRFSDKVNFASRRWNVLLLGLCRSREFCKFFIDYLLTGFIESLHTSMGLISVGILRILFHSPQSRYFLFLKGCNISIAELLQRVPAESESTIAAGLFDCLLSMKYIKKAIASLDISLVSSIIQRHCHILPEHCISLLSCLSAESLASLDYNSLVFLFDTYIHSPTLGKAALSLIQQSGSCTSTMRYFAEKFHSSPALYQYHFDEMFPYFKHTLNSSFAEDLPFIQHCALFVNTQKRAHPSWNELCTDSVNYVPFLSLLETVEDSLLLPDTFSSTQPVMIDANSLGQNSRFFAFFLANFHPPYLLPERISVLRSVSQFLADGVFPNNDFALFTDMLSFADKYLLQAVVDLMEDAYLTYFDPIQILKHGFWVSRDFEYELALRILQSAHLYVNEEVAIEWALKHIFPKATLKDYKCQ